MKKFFKKSIAMILVLMTVISCLCIPTFAATTDTSFSIINKKDKTLISTAFGAKDGVVNIAGGDATVFTVAKGGASVTFRSGTFLALTEAERKEAMSSFVTKLSNAGVTADTSQGVYDWLSSQADVKGMDTILLTLIFKDTKADLATAMKWFSPFNGLVGMILGVAVIILIVLLIGSSALDLVYISYPIFRESRDNSNAGSGKPPMGISRDAWDLVKTYEGSNAGGGEGSAKHGNIIWAYLKKRLFTYIIMAICILYLISGSLAGLIGSVLNLVSGIV